MRIAATTLLLAILTVQPALAGAWTMDRGKVQVISGVISSRASGRFDRHGSPTERTVFNKMLVQGWMEYGLTDAVTLYCAPEYVMADAGPDAASVTHYNSKSVEAGARVLLLTRIGMLSLQLSGKSAGAFDMSVSAGGESGSQYEARLLYGRSFKLFRHDGFFDIEAAQRWISRPRPNEFTLDATAGLWLSRKYLLMFQSFNTISSDDARPPYAYYRLHKVQASLVQKITRRWSVQAGYFYSLAGQSIVQEQGFITQLWFQT